ncbi:MAG: hypothetical protein KGL74_01530 [Elusimicrobia bacterium]|nr:hypothetical protein [Elusimicrobiota bacterium]
MERARSYYLTNRYSEALRDWMKALKLDRGLAPEIRAYVDQIEKKTGPTAPKKKKLSARRRK